MKIIYYFKLQHTHMYLWQIKHIVNELSLHNITIDIFNPIEYTSIEQANECLLNKVKNEHYDLFMTPCTDKDLFIHTLNDIKQLGIPTLLICFDNLTVPFAHKNIAPHFDIVWLTSIETKYLFDKWGCNSIFLPYAANPNLYNPTENKINQIVFIGTPYGSRSRMINKLLNAQIPLTLFANLGSNRTERNKNKIDLSQKINHTYHMLRSGVDMIRFPIGRRLALGSIINKISQQSVLDIKNSFLTCCKPVDFDAMTKLYNSYDLALSSITNRHTGVLKKPVLVINLRNFEIPCAGGCLFCLWNDELNEYFEDTKEAIYYHNDDDMVDKACFYLNPKNSSLINTIKQNARIKAINKHSWYCRFSEIFNHLGIK